MNSVKQHYDQHLAHFYDWMIGDFEAAQIRNQAFFESNRIQPKQNGLALDLGAGHGLQSISLANLGFDVKAVDFNVHLLEQLGRRSLGKNIETVELDFRLFVDLNLRPELIVCMGDTIAHLDSFEELHQLTRHCYDGLGPGGKLVLSFRDYSTVLNGSDRFIPVKSDEEKILTCILDYNDEYITVTDLLQEKTERKWVQKVSSYKKIRLTTDRVRDSLINAGFTLASMDIISRQVHVIATK